MKLSYNFFLLPALARSRLEKRFCNLNVNTWLNRGYIHSHIFQSPFKTANVEVQRTYRRPLMVWGLVG